MVTDRRAVPAELATGTLLGDWRIEGRIGQGGMGTVYAAVHDLIGKRAAIKVVRAELCTSALTAERFVQEAKVVNQIGHPNIVDIFHIGRLRDGRPYLVMELLQGRTLADRLAEGRMSPLEAIDVLLEIMAAAAAAHARGVIHRDLKPDNIFLAVDGARTRVKLVDWGIAKLTEAPPPIASASGSGSGPLTTTGMLLGTPQYVSPEQARGRELDARTDIYSLGAIAYEMLLESPPFVADSVADIVAMHLREPPPPPSDVWPDIPQDLERILVEMLAKEPGDRPGLTDLSVRLMMVRRELEARTSNPSLRRLAAGSLPPGLPSLRTAGASPATGAARRGATAAGAAGRPVTGREPTMPLTTTPARAVAMPTPSSMQVVPDLSGEVPAIDADAVAELPAARPGRSGWLWAAVVVGVCGVVAAAIMAARGTGSSSSASAAGVRAAAAELQAQAAERARARAAEQAGTAPRVAAAGGGAGASAVAGASGAGAGASGAGASGMAAGAAGAPRAAHPASAPSRLEMRVTPSDAWISIDGARVDVVHGHVVRVVAPGKHELRAGAPGYVEYARSIDVAGRVVVDVSLTRVHRRSPTRPKAPTDGPKPLDPNATIEPF